jgi:hypothetical protein
VASHLIATYRNVPGEHCGSTAMRNLIRHYCALELPEAVVFGLGSGIHCMLLESDRYDPSVMLFGRSATMETDVADALGLAYVERTEVDDRAAWDVVRAEVAADRPTMLSGDAFYLHYRDFKVHFPAHRFVLVGFDDETRMAAVVDRIDAAPQPCSYDALAASRNPKDFISTQNLWGRFTDGSTSRSLPEACAIALRRAATRMLAEPGEGDTTPGPAGGMQDAHRSGTVARRRRDRRPRAPGHLPAHGPRATERARPRPLRRLLYRNLRHRRWQLPSFVRLVSTLGPRGRPRRRHDRRRRRHGRVGASVDHALDRAATFRLHRGAGRA